MQEKNKKTDNSDKVYAHTKMKGKVAEVKSKGERDRGLDCYSQSQIQLLICNFEM